VMHVSAGKSWWGSSNGGVDVHLEVTTDEEFACHFDSMWLIETLGWCDVWESTALI